ncbi:hypothetical protein GGS20DRAFT_590952 [Poronia punctata]|nr:hypothetical protein GGS20DRAFT_590952 [Poronia punctata]
MSAVGSLRTFSIHLAPVRVRHEQHVPSLNPALTPVSLALLMSLISGMPCRWLECSGYLSLPSAAGLANAHFQRI